MICVVKHFLQYLNSVWREGFTDHFLCSGPSSSTGSVRHPSPFISTGSAQTQVFLFFSVPAGPVWFQLIFVTDGTVHPQASFIAAGPYQLKAFVATNDTPT